MPADLAASSLSTRAVTEVTLSVSLPIILLASSILLVVVSERLASSAYGATIFGCSIFISTSYITIILPHASTLEPAILHPNSPNPRLLEDSLLTGRVFVNFYWCTVLKQRGETLGCLTVARYLQEGILAGPGGLRLRYVLVCHRAVAQAHRKLGPP